MVLYFTYLDLQLGFDSLINQGHPFSGFALPKIFLHNDSWLLTDDMLLQNINAVHNNKTALKSALTSEWNAVPVLLFLGIRVLTGLWFRDVGAKWPDGRVLATEWQN